MNDLPPPEQTPHASRRDFHLAALALLAGTSLAPAAPTPAGQQGDPVAAAADGLLDVLRSRYGKQLSDEQLKELRTTLERNLRGGGRLHQHKLANGDEPASVFSADVAP